MSKSVLGEQLGTGWAAVLLWTRQRQGVAISVNGCIISLVLGMVQVTGSQILWRLQLVESISTFMLVGKPHDPNHTGYGL